LGSNLVPSSYVEAYTACCRRIVSGAESPHEGGEELMEVVARAQSFVALPGEAFNLWAELTDRWEWGDESLRARSEELMRQAAASFLELEDPASELPQWSESWFARIFQA
jgi:hypothetical protein